jgi:hypothetical protein
MNSNTKYIQTYKHSNNHFIDITNIDKKDAGAYENRHR